jgi:hypothetical protein
LGSYFVDRTDITLTFSQPVTDWTMRPRPRITSKVFGSGLSWFSVEVRPVSAAPSTLEMTATNGSCSVSSGLAIAPVLELPSTDVHGAAARARPDRLGLLDGPGDELLSAAFYASAMLGAALWVVRRQTNQG